MSGMTRAADDRDAIVVGAGPAGSAAATVLAENGWRVLVLEKDRFPRPKVCGEFLSGDAGESLARLRVRSRIGALSPERIESGEIVLPGGRRVAFRLSAAATGISRRRLDALLAERAQEVGAEIRFGARVLAVEGNPEQGFRVRVRGADEPQEIRARLVVGAWGRWDALDRELGRRFLARRRFFGWNRDYSGGADDLAGRVRLFVFPGGYCGLSRVEGGEVNLAGVISERRRKRIPGGWDAVLAHARRSNSALDGDLARLRPGPTGFLGTVPVVFSAKPPAERGILLAGDAAGVLDPFSGTGQSAALAAGILAGEVGARCLEGAIAERDLPARYAREWRRRFGPRFRWSGVLRRLMLHPVAGEIAGSLAGERLVRFGIGALHAGPGAAPRRVRS